MGRLNAEGSSVPSYHETRQVLQNIPVEYLLLFIEEQGLLPHILTALTPQEQSISLGIARLAATGLKLRDAVVDLTNYQLELIVTLSGIKSRDGDGTVTYCAVRSNTLIELVNPGTIVDSDYIALRTRISNLKKKLKEFYRNQYAAQSILMDNVPWIISKHNFGYQLVIVPVSQILDGSIT